MYYVTAAGVVVSAHRNVGKALVSRRKHKRARPKYSYAIVRLEGKWSPGDVPAQRYWHNSVCIGCGAELARGVEPRDSDQRCKPCWNAWMDRGARDNDIGV